MYHTINDLLFLVVMLVSIFEVKQPPLTYPFVCIYKCRGIVNCLIPCVSSVCIFSWTCIGLQTTKMITELMTYIWTIHTCSKGACWIRPCMDEFQVLDDTDVFSGVNIIADLGQPVSIPCTIYRNLSLWNRAHISRCWFNFHDKCLQLTQKTGISDIVLQYIMKTGKYGYLWSTLDISKQNLLISFVNVFRSDMVHGDDDPDWIAMTFITANFRWYIKKNKKTLQSLVPFAVSNWLSNPFSKL